MRMLKIAAVMLAVLVSGCTEHSKGILGGLAGAAAGGYGGSFIGKGMGNKMAIAGGAIGGGLLGNWLLGSLDKADTVYDQRQQQPMAMQGYGQPAPYYPPPAPAPYPQAAPYGYAPPAPSPSMVAYSPGMPGGVCREFQSTVLVGGVARPAVGMACMAPDGSWHIVR